MRAWRLTAPGKIELVDLDSQPVGAGCVKIKLRYSAISASDLMAYDGKVSFDAPLIPGRQGIGMVTEVGEGVKSVVRGDIVAIRPFSACDGCLMCKKGDFELCENKLVRGVNEDGFLCDFAVVSASDVYKLPERIDKKNALLLEHVDIAISIINKLKLERGEHIVIAGASYLGIIIAQLAMSYQAVPIIVDVDDEKLAEAAKYVYYAFNYSQVDIRKKVLTLTGGRMSQMAVHLHSSALPINQTLALVGKSGRVAIAGWENSVNLSGMDGEQILDKQLTVVGINGSNNNFPAAINMMVNHTVKMDFENLPEVNFADLGELFKSQKRIENRFIYTRVVME
ncbi:MAG: hypothetical protein E7350_02770 [Clostridiales bacterium]|nr:hypothetical protein [Clostridiales bacterium]